MGNRMGGLSLWLYALQSSRFILTFGSKRVCTSPVGLFSRAQGKPAFLLLTYEPGAACHQ